MTTLIRGGNIGSVAVGAHPNGTNYLYFKRDVPGSCACLYEQAHDGRLTRCIFVWANRSDFDKIVKMIKDEEKAAGRPTTFGTQQVEKPISSPTLLCRPDGSIRMLHTFGGGDGYTDLSYEDIPGVYEPWTPTGTWPLTVSATDTDARKAAQGARDRADVAARMADSAQGTADTAKSRVDALAKAGTGGVTLKAISDDIASDTGTLRHALFPRVQRIVADVVYLMLKDKDSPLINVIRQGGRVIE